MTTKPKSVLAWAVMDCDTNLPWLEMVTPDEVRANTWREMGHELLRVRITVVRERKKRRECKCTLAQRLVGDGCDVCNREPKVWAKKATKRRAKR